MNICTDTSPWSMSIHTFTMSTISTRTVLAIRQGSRIRIGTSMVNWCIHIRTSRIFTIGMGMAEVGLPR